MSDIDTIEVEVPKIIEVEVAVEGPQGPQGPPGVEGTGGGAAIGTEETARKAADKVEQEARQNADTILTTSIAAEEAARKTADTSLAAAVTTEEAARKVADGVVAAAVTTEEAARKAADEAETAARIAAVAAEEARAKTAEALALLKTGGVVTGAITLPGNAMTNLQAVPLQQVKAEITALINGAPGALDTLGEIATALETDTGAIATLQSAIVKALVATNNLNDLTNVASARGNLGLGSAAVQASAAFDAAGTAAAAQAASQPLDADLSAIALLTTSAFGRELLTKATALAVREVLGLGTAAVAASTAFDAAGAAAAAQTASQPLHANLTALTLGSPSTTYGRSIIVSGAAANARTTLGLGTAAVEPATAFDLAGAATAAKTAAAAAYRQILNASGRQVAGEAGAIYFFSGETDAKSPLAASGGSITSLHSLLYVPADQAVEGKTTKFMMRVLSLGGALPAVTIKVGLYPVTIGTGSFVAGTLVPGSQVEFVNPAVGVAPVSTGDFTPPAEGLYMLGYTVTATVGGGRMLSAQLYAHNV